MCKYRLKFAKLHKIPQFYGKMLTKSHSICIFAIFRTFIFLSDAPGS